MYFEVIKGFAQYYIKKKLALYFDGFRIPPAPNLAPDSFFQANLYCFWLLAENDKFCLISSKNESLLVEMTF